MQDPTSQYFAMTVMNYMRLGQMKPMEDLAANTKWEKGFLSGLPHRLQSLLFKFHVDLITR